MASTFFGLTIASSGLRAANAALNTTGNNISNVDTFGYSRQEVKQEASAALRVFTKYGCAGAGVDTLAIERVRDSFYDTKFRENETRLGEYDVKAYYMRLVEEYFADDDVTGFKAIYNKISDALQEVTKNPGSPSYKSNFISSIKNLTDYFNNMYGDMQNLQADINDEIKIRVDKINAIAQDLAILNKQINTVEMSGTIANELRDKRDILLDDLSAIVDVEVIEEPIYDKSGNLTGAHRCIVRIAGGQTLVDQNDYNQLICKSRTAEEKVNQSDIDGLYDIYWSSGIEFSLTNASMYGELRGLVQLRDGNNGEYFNGTVSDIQYNGSTTKVTIKTTAAYLDNMSKCKLSDSGGIINIGNKLYYYTGDWTYDEETGAYTFTIDNDKSDSVLRADMKGKDVRIGAAVNYQGIPYYMAQMNEWIRDFAKALNDKFYNDGYTSDGDKAGILFTGMLPKGDGQYGAEQFYDSDKNNGRGYYFLTAGNLTVLNELMYDGSLLGVKLDQTAGVEECEIIKQIISLMSDTNQFSFRGRDSSGFLECMLSDITLSSKNAQDFYGTYLSLEMTIDNQRTSISGVDEDEEAVNLVKYENAYTLASKMISVLTEVYDRLILETGV